MAIDEKKPKEKKPTVMYYCNEPFVHGNTAYQEHQIFDGSTWPKSEIEEALLTRLIRKVKGDTL
jgi:hypothetical protein